MIDVAKSDIKVPVDIQDALEILESLMAASGLVAQSITMDKRGYGFVQALAKSNTPGELHTWTLEFSFDNATWYTEYVSGAPEVSINRTSSSAARYWRLSSNNNGGAAHTVDLVLAATNSS
jgi:hypothetical protein